MSEEDRKRQILTQAWLAGVRATHPEHCLEAHLPAAPDKGHLFLLAGGKAAGAMMKVAARHYLNRINKERLCGVVVTKHEGRLPLFHMTQIEAGHPVPDIGSQNGAEQALLLANRAGKDDLVVVLLSGGVSALWSAPVMGVALADKQKLTRQLLRSGASIAQINTVRKHLSKIKGGRLAQIAAPARLVTLAISDVAGDDPAVIGSGPTMGDPTSLHDARSVLADAGIDIAANIAQALANPKNETPEPHDDVLGNGAYVCIANGATALHGTAAKLQAEGYVVMNLGDAIEGEAGDVARAHAKLALAQKKSGRPIAILSGGELTVTVTGKGRGGPSQEYALALAIALEGAEGIFALAGDSDGCDGGEGKPEDPTGGFVFPSTLARAEGGEGGQKLKPATFLDDNDSGTFFLRLDDLFFTRPTDTNVNDLRIILVG